MLYNFCIFDAEGLERDKLVMAFEKAVKEGRAVKLHKPGVTKITTKTRTQTRTKTAARKR